MSKSFAVRKDAMEWGRQMEVKADRADLPTDPRALERITLGDLVRRYIDTVSSRKKTAATETIVLNAFRARKICSRRLSELRTEDFADHRDERLKVIKPTSLKRELTPVRHLFEVARYEWGLPLKDNPLDRLKLKAPEQRRERRLLNGEWESLLEAARFCRNPWIEPIMRLALATGMRRGEILAIEDNQINFERRSLLIRETKNGNSRTIPLTREAIQILEQLPKGRGLLFPITSNAFRLAWEHLRERADLGDLHFHDLRHEAISRFFELGLNPPEVALISGHRDMRQLFRYTHPLREGIIDKMDRPT
jgi:integrase